MRNPLAVAADRIRPRADSGGYYAGASGGGLFYDFVMGTLSANGALRGSLTTLRNRARELVTKNGTAGAIPQIFSEQVIGETGVSYQAAVAAPDGTKDERTNRELEYHFQRWSEARFCTVDRALSRLELDALITESEITDGEVLARHVEGFPNEYGYAIELLDPDQLDLTVDRPASPGYNRIVMGVEVDEWGGPLWYHLFANHPTDRLAAGRMKVPAHQIIHRFVRRRVGQLRGVTAFAPALVDLAMHGGYRQAELISSRTASTKQGMFEVGEDAEALEVDGKPYVPNQARPGMFDQLPKGFKFVQWDPQHPTTAFKDFDTSILRSIGVAFRVSSLHVSGNMTDTSWSSGRLGRQNEIAVFGRMQVRHVATITKPSHEAWLRSAMLKGALNVRALPLATLTMASWHPEPFDWPDPEADLNVALAERRSGLTSLQRIARRLGRDTREIFREIAEENQWAAAEGITLDMSPVASARAPLYGAPVPNQGGAPAPGGADGHARPPLRAIRGGEG